MDTILKSNLRYKPSYPIIIELDEDKNYIVTCPVFKACYTYGKSIDEALKNIREVISLCEEEDLLPENKFIGFMEIPMHE